MGRKGKTQKHTAKEIAGKVKAAKERNGAAGGGGKGAEARMGAWTKASVLCDVCKTIQPSFKTMQIHYENKHPKDSYPAEDYEKRFAEARFVFVLNSRLSNLIHVTGEKLNLTKRVRKL